MSMADALDALSKREREVVALALRGCTDKEVSARLRISYATVRTTWHGSIRSSASRAASN
jgi:DNA-binding CsgD family transcriptional regulator